MIDLHMHSLFSNDGEYSPETLAQICSENGIYTMSITDHNTVKAQAEGRKSAADYGIKYISGIEIDCVFQETNFHVLGYNIDFENDDFSNIEKNIRTQSKHASILRLKKTQELGFNISGQDLCNISKNNYWSEEWTGELFAEVLLNHPEYKHHPMLKPYRQNGDRCDNPYVNFYWDFYAQNKSCYVPIKYPSMQDTIDIIHNNGGVAVLAHPGVNLKEKERLLKDIISLGIDGIEVFSSYHSAKDSEFYYEVCKQNKLIYTCGSDFHGKTKPSLHIGGHNCSLPQKEIFTNLDTLLK